MNATSERKIVDRAEINERLLDIAYNERPLSVFINGSILTFSGHGIVDWHIGGYGLLHIKFGDNGSMSLPITCVKFLIYAPLADVTTAHVILPADWHIKAYDMPVPEDVPATR